MKRRSFLQFLGLAPAAAVAPKASASEKFAELSKRLDLPPAQKPPRWNEMPVGMEVSTMCVFTSACTLIDYKEPWKPLWSSDFPEKK